VSDVEHGERQRRFYETREHEHLQARGGDFYARKLAGALAGALGMGPHHRVLELGAGFGRFTFPLLEHCGSLTAVDLAARVADSLSATRDARRIP